MNLFYNDTEMLVFVLLAIPFIGVVVTMLTCLYSDAFVQAHTVLARRMFTGKSKKLGRVIVCGIIAIICQHYRWLMLETLLIAYMAYHLAMLAFFRNKVQLNLSFRKH
jgi:hypothetical protein